MNKNTKSFAFLILLISSPSCSKETSKDVKLRESCETVNAVTFLKDKPKCKECMKASQQRVLGIVGKYSAFESGNIKACPDDSQCQNEKGFVDCDCISRINNGNKRCQEFELLIESIFTDCYATCEKS